mgnify:CR=1 FL=1
MDETDFIQLLLNRIEDAAVHSESIRQRESHHLNDSAAIKLRLEEVDGNLRKALLYLSQWVSSPEKADQGELKETVKEFLNNKF